LMEVDKTYCWRRKERGLPHDLVATIYGMTVFT
jgi:hypothetical protein